MKKRLISLLMALAMAAALLPLDAALAADGEEGRTPAEAAFVDDAQVPEATSDPSAPEDTQPEGEEQPDLSLQEASEGEAEPEQESEKPNQKEDYLRRPTGYIPIQKDLYVADPAALQTLEGEDVPLKEELPAAYRSDEQPWAAKIRVKDQMKTHLCWAFAMTSAAEYSYAKELYEKTGEIYSGELSPGHIAQFFYNRVMDPLENTEGDFNDSQEWEHFSISGGDELHGMQHLATWSGIVSESAAPIEAINDHVIVRKDQDLWDESNSPYPSSLAYGHNELILEEGIYYNALNPAILKQMVYQYGACTVAMEFDYQFMNLEEHNPETGKAYAGGRSFYNDTGEVSMNHTLTLVGWDDNYPKENFRRTVKTEDNKTKVVMPEKDGAWIIQNSWGDIHEHGFLYASYESADFNVDDVQVIAFDMQSADTYDYNFQYDGTAGIADTNVRSIDGRRMPYRTTPGTSAANVYTNTTGHPIRLEAVGYTTFNLGQTDYDVSVYTGLTDPNNPQSGTLWGTTRISSTKAGCKTGILDQSVVVKPGETFSIVFQFPDFTAFGIEKTNSDSILLINAQTDPGQSFFKPAKSGSGWKDMDDYDACFRIKGFASACTYDLSGEQVVFSQKVSGKTKKPEILSIGGMQLQEGKDYTAKWSGLTVRIQGKGDYTGTTEAVWEAGKAANPMTVQGKTASVSYKALSKKNQTLAATKLFRVSGNQGKVRYQKAGGNAGILIAADGKVTVKKGLKKNTYTVKAKVTAAGNDSYRAGTKTVKIKIKVK